MPSADFHAIAYIPGDSENSTRSGDDLWSAIPHLANEGSSSSLDIEIGPLGLEVLEVTFAPLFDNWLVGDMIDESDVANWPDARTAMQDKYEENGGMSGPKYRIRTDVSISITTDGSGGIDTKEVDWGNSRSSYTVLEQEAPSSIKQNVDSDGNMWSDPAPKRRYYNVTEETINGVETVRVSTIFGGYARMAEYIADYAEEIGVFNFLKENGWNFEALGQDVDPDTVDTIGPLRFGSLIANLAGIVPNTYHFSEFFLTADGAKYVRLWDKSLYPRHAIYIGNDREYLSQFDWQREALMELFFFYFYYEYFFGTTPYTQPHHSYIEQIRKEVTPQADEIQAEFDRLITILPNLSPDDFAPYLDFIDDVPVTQFGEDANGNELSSGEVESILPSDVLDPFENSTSHADQPGGPSYWEEQVVD